MTILLDLLASSPTMLVQVVGSTPGLGRAVIMLLLLAGLLSIEGNRRHYVPWVILAGIVPSLITDVHDIEPAWPFISALLLPPLMWQVAIRVTVAQPPANWQDLLIWLLTAAAVGMVLIAVASLPLASGLLLGLLVVSLVWQVRERSAERTLLGRFGQLTLAFLLVEVERVSYPPGEWIGTIFSGVGLGLVLGFVGVRVALRLPKGELQKLLLLGLSYAAYLIGLLPDVSGVAAIMMTGLVAAIYGQSVGLWPTSDGLQTPLNWWPVFVLASAAWLLLGWQAHTILTPRFVAAIVLSLLAVSVGIVVARRLAPIETAEILSLGEAIFRKGRKTFLLLAGAVLLWPQTAVLEPRPLIVALSGSLVTVFLLHLAVRALLDLTSSGT